MAGADVWRARSTDAADFLAACMAFIELRSELGLWAYVVVVVNKNIYMAVHGTRGGVLEARNGQSQSQRRALSRTQPVRAQTPLRRQHKWFVWVAVDLRGPVRNPPVKTGTRGVPGPTSLPPAPSPQRAVRRRFSSTT